jgi:hypothetical protein
MDLAQMETIATDLAALGERVGALEDAPPADAIAVPNIYKIDVQGKAVRESISGVLTWRGTWDPQSAYDVDDVVRFKAKSYVAIEAVGERPPALAPLPPSADLANFTEKDIAQVLNDGIEAGGTIKPKDPLFLGHFEGKYPAVIYQFRAVNKTLLTLPKNEMIVIGEGAGENGKISFHYFLYNSDAIIANNLLECVKQEITAGVADPTLYFLVVAAIAKGKFGELLPITSSLPIVVEPKGEPALIEEPGNPEPAADPLNWRVLAGA